MVNDDAVSSASAKSDMEKLGETWCVAASPTMRNVLTFLFDVFLRGCPLSLKRLEEAAEMSLNVRRSLERSAIPSRHPKTGRFLRPDTRASKQFSTKRSPVSR